VHDGVSKVEHVAVAQPGVGPDISHEGQHGVLDVLGSVEVLEQIVVVPSLQLVVAQVIRDLKKNKIALYLKRILHEYLFIIVFNKRVY